MHKVLVLGAGLVSKPLVRYLLEQPDFHVKVASRTVSKAEKLIDNHPDGEAQSLNVKDTAALGKLVQEAERKYFDFLQSSSYTFEELKRRIGHR